MDLTVDRIYLFLTGSLPQADRLAVEAALARSPEAQATLARLSAARSTVVADAAWSVPSAAIERAKALGSRLERLRSPSLLDRLSSLVNAIVAELRFDSRLDGALVGLRGGTGFALSFRAGELEIDLECDSNDDETFAILGQVTASEGAEALPTHFEVHAESDDATQVVIAASGPIDRAGLFRCSLPAGRVLLRFVTPNGVTIDIPSVEIP
jgi:hypothetical protein